MYESPFQDAESCEACPDDVRRLLLRFRVVCFQSCEVRWRWNVSHHTVTVEELRRDSVLSGGYSWHAQRQFFPFTCRKRWKWSRHSLIMFGIVVCNQGSVQAPHACTGHCSFWSDLPDIKRQVHIQWLLVWRAGGCDWRGADTICCVSCNERGTGD
jgi:hypothetical protein